MYRWVQKFGPEIRKRAYGRHRSWRGLQWHVDEACVRVNGRWCYLWRAVDQRGQLINFRLTVRRNGNAARAFMRQASETVRCFRPMTIVTDKAHNYIKVIKEMNRGCGPEEAIRHVARKHLNNRIEGDRHALKQLLKPKRGFRSLSAAKDTPKGIETFRGDQERAFSGQPNRRVLSQILLEFECGHRPDITMLRAPQTAEMQ